MKIIIKERGEGKTNDLIKMSAETGFYIVTFDQRHAHIIADRAKEIGLKIPFPITFQEFIERSYYGRGVKGLLIDEAPALLQAMASREIKAITLSPEDR